ncbi:tRNA (adenosine(37)-N6)-threonylcarbamoyltransferase complex transferase subunit TsaD [Candidatus Uhrbacteria bacterium RIFOXYB2_FULL_45_11]|uniref:tRNA N6-adenosine threonylcarbamoyltransferase n=1 Tax=Candidatus Uhrbacteria bacterium RIFOXYB2_FULL_45_11 TaxID=1802421 RepID=A0A1F7W3W1_9BACT|nr:MAG: tRNA (adenosine(37)-N6)-threonylcarbamoyltransferase complex transferase subunit TsaD [Candidatus Uhrbacteria bacterium RIFOXYB2_FULL_45_11]
MRILGIESSCDETAMSIVSKNDGVIVIEKSLVASQIDLHKIYGGVVPEVAAREHVSAIFPMLLELGVSRDGHEIDAIAVTAGPGLVAALRIGVELAKTLAWLWNKPLVATNHLEGHVYSVWSQTPTPAFPALCLLVSGGHTELFLMRDHGQYEPIGMTRDDAAGEAFDKVAKLLGLGYPGGPAISKMALDGNPNAIAFPRPMLESGDFDFSFSGLKTAVRVYLQSNLSLPAGRQSDLSDISNLSNIPDIAASFQQAVVDILTIKTLSAVQRFAPKSVILSGGVSANRALRESLSNELAKQFPDVTFHAPDLSLSGDNAVMIAIAGLHRAEQKDFVDPLTLQANPNMRLL